MADVQNEERSDTSTLLNIKVFFWHDSMNTFNIHRSLHFQCN